MDFDEAQERLDIAFGECYHDEARSDPFDDRRHLVVTCAETEREVERVLTALMGSEEAWYLDYSRERTRGLEVRVSIYSDAEP